MDPPRPPVRRTLPLVGLLLFVIAGFVRLLPHWTTRVVASGGASLHPDASLHLWQYSWLRRTLASGTVCFDSDGLVFPERVDLLSLWEGHLDLLVAAPVVGALGPAAAANTAAIAHLALLAVGAYVLGRSVARDAWAAATGATLLVLSPVFLREFHEGRIEAGSVGCLALALAWAGRWQAGGGVRFLFGFAAALAAGIVGYLHLGVLAACLLPLLALGCLAAGRDPGAPPRARRVARALALAGVLAILALLAARFASLHVGTFRASLLDLGLLRDPSWHAWVERTRHNGLSPWELVRPFPWMPHAGSGGVLPLVALLSLLGPHRRRTLPWWFGAAGLHLAALGTAWSLGAGRVVLSPLGYLPLVLPFLLRFQFPQRFLLAGDLCLAVLAALGIAAVGARLAARTATPRRRLLALVAPVLGVVLLGLVQALPGWPFGTVEAASPSPAVAFLAAEAPRAVLEVPAPGGPLWMRDRKPFLYDRYRAAAMHDAPLCCATLPEERSRSVEGAEASGAVSWLLRGQGDPERGPSIEALGFSHVVVHGASCYATAVRPAGVSAPPDCRTVLAFLEARYGRPTRRWSTRGDVIAIWRLGPTRTAP
ncbi:MAG: hypothetical protein JXB39_11285 [Deltaproteobacteria bacterium]|nr:hypothetical protein [Deltaproteobacteria bacterium]